MVLSVDDYAYFSKLAYLPKAKIEQQLIADGKSNWKIISINGGINGFQAVAFGEITNSDAIFEEVVIAYAGTNSISDIIYDDILGIASGNVPGQYTGALNFYNSILQMDNVSSNAEIVLTGHSLGGALAQLVGAKESLSAITFNAPGMMYALSQIGCSSSDVYDYIQNYIVMNDYVGNFREHIGKEYYYEPIPINDDSLRDTHTEILELGNDGGMCYNLCITWQ